MARIRLIIYPLLYAASLAVTCTAAATPPDGRGSDDDRRGHALLAAARVAREELQPRFGERFREAASVLAQEGDFNTAAAALDELLADPGSEFDRIEAQRMKAQYLIAANQPAEAWVYVTAALQHIDGNPDLKRFGPSYFALIYTGTLCRSLAADAAGELELLERITTADRERFGQENVASAMVRKASILERTGERAGAIATIDQLLALYPDWGREDGRRLNVRFNQLCTRFPERNSHEFINGLRELWDDPANRSHTEVLTVGNQLRQSLERAGDGPGAAALARQMVALIELREDGWLAASRSRSMVERSIRLFEFEQLEYLAWSAPHSPADSLWAIGRLLERERNTFRREALMRVLLERLTTP